MTSPAIVSLDEAQADATAATTAADAVRARLAAGEDVGAAELAEVEAAEQHAVRRLDAARQRDADQRARDAAEQRARDREHVATEWATLRSRVEPTELAELRTEAARVAAKYLRAVTEHQQLVEQVRERARDLGLEAGRAPQFPRSPLPTLARAILDEAGSDIPLWWSRPDVGETVWGR